MVSTKKLNVIIYKADDYRPPTKYEKRRITRLIMREIFDLINRFDGTTKLKIELKAKGNA